MSSERFRFSAIIPIYELEIEYKHRFAGNEADIRFCPTQNVRMMFDVELPMMARVLGIEDKLKQVFNHAHREVCYEMSRVVSEALLASTKPELTTPQPAP